MSGTRVGGGGRRGRDEERVFGLVELGMLLSNLWVTCVSQVVMYLGRKFKMRARPPGIWEVEQGRMWQLLRSGREGGGGCQEGMTGQGHRAEKVGLTCSHASRPSFRQVQHLLKDGAEGEHRINIWRDKWMSEWMNECSYGPVSVGIQRGPQLLHSHRVQGGTALTGRSHHPESLDFWAPQRCS